VTRFTVASVRDELKRQKLSNKNTLPFYGAFEEHRRHTTGLLVAAVEAKRLPAAPRLCVLGAGNCFDLDLATLAQHFSELHLVDLDSDALRRAKARQPKPVQERMRLHGDVDLSGANAVLGNWRDMKVTPAELMAFPSEVPGALCRKLPGPFDVVVSTCLASQLLLTLRRVLHERHPLFNAASLTLLITHLRLLVALSGSEGQALLVTDVASNEIAPLREFGAAPSPQQFLQSLMQSGKVFNALDPDYLSALAAEDPVITRRGGLSQPLDVWLWQNGPDRTFLVYASSIG
jgi:hypothetical protein